MRQYLRLMRRRNEHQPSEAELDALANLLKNAPGASEIEFQGRHPKGGYRVTLNVADESLNEFITLLERSDWMSVL